jgi:4-diphosphocytidyl-2C-methyl-D-erythritol kinase
VAVSLRPLQPKNDDKLYNMNQSINLRAYAKINLDLYVLGKRDDGYHLLDSHMSLISLYDSISIELTSKPKDTDNKQATLNDIMTNTSLVVLDERKETSQAIPTNSDNLILKAISAFFEALDWKKMEEFSINLQLTKLIPAAAGLGGGSADAATTLIGLNDILGKPFSLKELADIGQNVGADVPYLVYANAYANKNELASPCDDALAVPLLRVCGIGEDILSADESCCARIFGDRKSKTEQDSQTTVVLLKPSVSLSTASVFAKLDSLSPPTEQNTDVTVNDLQAPAIAMEPIIAKCLSVLDTVFAGKAKQISMSGSGPSVFALVNTPATDEEIRTVQQRLPSVSVYRTELVK